MREVGDVLWALGFVYGAAWWASKGHSIVAGFFLVCALFVGTPISFWTRKR